MVLCISQKLILVQNLLDIGNTHICENQLIFSKTKLDSVTIDTHVGFELSKL